MDQDYQLRVDWSKFTPKQKKAIQGYIRTGNKFQSYIAAYDVKDPKGRTAKQNCYALFRQPHIKAVINQIQEAAVKIASFDVKDMIEGTIDDLIEEQKEVETLKIDAYWIMRKAASLAAFNIKKFIKDDSDRPYYDFSNATDEDWYCISEITMDEISKGSGEDKYYVDRIKIKGPDKLRALELTAKFLPKKDDEGDPLKQLQKAFHEAFNPEPNIPLD